MRAWKLVMPAEPPGLAARLNKKYPHGLGRVRTGASGAPKRTQGGCIAPTRSDASFRAHVGSRVVD